MRLKYNDREISEVTARSSSIDAKEPTILDVPYPDPPDPSDDGDRDDNVDNEDCEGNYDLWLQVLHVVFRGDSLDEANDNNTAQYCGNGSLENSFERREAGMAPLPENDIPDFPMEDKNYFRTKFYVRNDRYRLSDMMPNDDDITIPPIMCEFTALKIP